MKYIQIVEDISRNKKGIASIIYQKQVKFNDQQDEKRRTALYAFYKKKREKAQVEPLHLNFLNGCAIFTIFIPLSIIRKNYEFNKLFFAKNQCLSRFLAIFCISPENFRFFSLFFIKNTI